MIYAYKLCITESLKVWASSGSLTEGWCKRGTLGAWAKTYCDEVHILPPINIPSICLFKVPVKDLLLLAADGITVQPPISLQLPPKLDFCNNTIWKRVLIFMIWDICSKAYEFYLFLNTFSQCSLRVLRGLNRYLAGIFS